MLFFPQFTKQMFCILNQNLAHHFSAFANLQELLDSQVQHIITQINQKDFIMLAAARLFPLCPYIALKGKKREEQKLLIVFRSKEEI